MTPIQGAQSATAENAVAYGCDDRVVLAASPSRLLRRKPRGCHRDFEVRIWDSREEAEENADRLKAEAVKFLVDTNAEVDRLRAEADELTAKANAAAEATLVKANAEASEILAGARAESQDTLTRSQAEAEERRRRLEEELAALQQEAETRLREIKVDTQAMWRERDQMLDGIRTMANDLAGIATASVARLQPDQAASPDDEYPEPAAEKHDEPTTVATDEPASAVPAVGAQRKLGRGAPKVDARPGR